MNKFKNVGNNDDTHTHTMACGYYTHISIPAVGRDGSHARAVKFFLIVFS